MYRITSKALSPYPIETKQGWVTVPGRGSVIVDLSDAHLEYVENSGCYEVEAVEFAPPKPENERDRIIYELTERGIPFDGRMGVNKLRNLLRANS